ncbi:MAG: hypothetical protein L6Q99_06030 [Planctomycetes bacterium]|nr:hypothetical protein [Planctomycetota bacterium]
MTRWLVVACLLVFGAAAVFVWQRDDTAPALAPATPPVQEPGSREPGAREPGEKAGAAALDSRAAPVDLADPARGGDERDALAAPEAPAEQSPRPAAARFVVRGRVLDVDGAPVGRVALARDGAGSLGQAAADGSFALELDDDATFGVRSPQYVTVLPARTRAATNDALVVVAKTTRLFGRVRSADGSPIAGAALVGRIPAEHLARWTVVTPRSDASQATEPRSWRTETDATGRFAFEAFPALVGAELTVEASGFESTRIELDERYFGVSFDVELAR